MKKKKVLSLSATILIIALVCFAVFALLLRPQTLEIGAVDLNTVTDGEYIGVCPNKILIAVVKVCVKNHEIADIEILGHKAS